jgi:hypothetical protein
MWKVIGASVTGASHNARAIPCQDASGWQVNNDVTCLAVADGAGSRARSDQGARLAVEKALFLANAFARGPEPGDPTAMMRHLFADVHSQLGELAAAEGNSIGDYAATMAVAVMAGDIVCVGQVGDTIAVVGHQGHYESLSPPPHHEYVNETAFITDDYALDQARIDVKPGRAVDAVFLSTDGLRLKILADLAAATPFTPFFEDMQAYICSPEANVDAVRRFLTRLDDQSGDDKTLVAAIRDRLSQALEDSDQPTGQTGAVAGGAALTPAGPF